jgi:FkbM family methyltransferase
MKRLTACLFLSSSLFGISPDYISSWPGQADLIRDPYGKGDYLNRNFRKKIKKNLVQSVLEIGSRDLIDALELSEYYACHVYAFECNPEALSVCYHNLGKNPNVSIVPLAAWNETRPISFFPLVKEAEAFNLGAASLFKFDPKGVDGGRYEQTEITVQATRIDEWLNKNQLKTPDLICIDAQGASLQVLEGIGSRLQEVKYIVAEAELVDWYEGEALYPEIVNYMLSQGFVEAAVNNHGLYSDVLFIRKDLYSRLSLNLPN